MSNTRKLWIGLATLLVVSFGVLLWAGTEIFRAAPPVPEQVVAERTDRTRGLYPRGGFLGGGDRRTGERHGRADGRGDEKEGRQVP